jgi:hypothetical protein
LGSQVAQNQNASVTHHFACDLVDCRQNPADTARDSLVGHGAVSDREMTLLDEIVPVDLEQNIVIPRRGAAIKRPVNQRTDDVPDLGPAFAGKLSKGFIRVLGPEDRMVRVVIELDLMRSPPQDVRKAIGEHDAQHGTQCRRPS